MVVARAAAATAAGVSLGAIWATGLVSWRRTRALRRGQPGHRSPLRASSRSSATTWFAAAAGVAVLALGTLIVRDAPIAGAGAGVAGGLVATSGIRSRVTALEVRDDALVVRRALRPAVILRWAGLRSLGPPRTPAGGWRLRAEPNSITLMPWDLLGHEAVLAIAIERTGLWFDGRRWSQPP